MTQMNGWLRQILIQAPTLNTFGFGLGMDSRGKSDVERAAILAERRQSLLASADRVKQACTWVDAHLLSRGTLNHRHSSYGLKHLAEQDIGYLTNGQLIAAMIACGYRYQVVGMNAHFNISEREVTALYHRRRMQAS